MKRKIMVVVTARASYSRFKTALTALKDHPEVELFLKLLHQHFLIDMELQINLYQKMDLK